MKNSKEKGNQKQGSNTSQPDFQAMDIAPGFPPMQSSQLKPTELEQRSAARMDAIAKALQGEIGSSALTAIMFSMNSDSSSNEEKSQAQALWSTLSPEQQNEVQEIYQRYGGTVVKDGDSTPEHEGAKSSYKEEDLEVQWEWHSKESEDGKEHPRRKTHHINGVKQGLETRWYENGQKEREVPYVNGKIEGLQTRWHKNGQKEREVPYVNGKREGLQTEWHENGQKVRETPYVNDKQHGFRAIWHDNGQKKEEASYVDGKGHGLVTQWYKNGNKEAEWTEVHGEKHGLYTEWHVHGGIDHTTDYKHGVVISRSYPAENKKNILRVAAILLFIVFIYFFAD